MNTDEIKIKHMEQEIERQNEWRRRAEAKLDKQVEITSQLLRACQSALAGLERRGEGWSLQGELRAAIAKATGIEADA